MPTETTDRLEAVKARQTYLAQVGVDNIDTLKAATVPETVEVSYEDLKVLFDYGYTAVSIFGETEDDVLAVLRIGTSAAEAILVAAGIPFDPA